MFITLLHVDSFTTQTSFVIVLYKDVDETMICISKVFTIPLKMLTCLLQMLINLLIRFTSPLIMLTSPLKILTGPLKMLTCTKVN